MAMWVFVVGLLVRLSPARATLLTPAARRRPKGPQAALHHRLDHQEVRWQPVLADGGRPVDGSEGKEPDVVPSDGPKLPKVVFTKKEQRRLEKQKVCRKMNIRACFESLSHRHDSCARRPRRRARQSKSGSRRCSGCWQTHSRSRISGAKGEEDQTRRRGADGQV